MSIIGYVSVYVLQPQEKASMKTHTQETTTKNTKENSTGTEQK
jgi:hypothetical protein